MDLNNYKDSSKNVVSRYLDIKKCIDTQSILNNIDKLEKLTSDKDFWNDSAYAKKTLQSISFLKNKISFIEDIESKYEELKICIEIIE